MNRRPLPTPALAGPGPRAFTLIELLVVIATIAILAALLFPVFAKARERGRQAACASNLKQIGGAVQTYAADWDEVLVYRSRPGPRASAYDGWQWPLVPYLPGTEVWRCPSSQYSHLPGLLVKAEPGLFLYPRRQPLPGSYALNNALPWFSVVLSPDRYQAELPLHLVAEPAWFILVGESEGYPVFQPQDCLDFMVTGWHHMVARWLPEDGGVAGGLVRHHGDRTNLLFVDGHVEALRISQTLAPRQRWTPPDLEVVTALPLDPRSSSLTRQAVAEELQQRLQGLIPKLQPPCR